MRDDRQLAPGQVWYIDLEPVRGREQGKDRPALIVSSSAHLRVTAGQLVTILPMTSRERPWIHHVAIGAGGWVMTEQVRTISAERLRRRAPNLEPTPHELEDVRSAFRRMLDT